MHKKLDAAFYRQDAVTVARLLLGKTLVRRLPDGRTARYPITETEAYVGETDKACHASRGRTTRTEVMYHDGGTVYIYLIYGMHWMLNVVTSTPGNPQAVLIRGIGGHSGPGTGGLTSKLFWDYYAFTADRKILKEVSYPVIEGVARFLSKTVVDTLGYTLAYPSSSPEQFSKLTGKPYPSMGCAFDLMCSVQCCCKYAWALHIKFC